MSAGNVEKVIGSLLSDEELRIRFAHDRLEALADLYERGLTLTADEIDVFVQSDALVWFAESRHVRGHLH